jgi:hypothetical protein
VQGLLRSATAGSQGLLPGARPLTRLEGEVVSLHVLPSGDLALEVGDHIAVPIAFDDRCIEGGAGED